MTLEHDNPPHCLHKDPIPPFVINLAVSLSQTLIKTPHAILELATSLPRFEFNKIQKKPLRITIPHSHTLLY